MPTKRAGGHPVNGGGRELQALLDSSMVIIADKDDAAGQIPWRTSRRLQEATLRSLIKERDIDNTTMTSKKEKESLEAVPPRSLKRQRSPLSPSSPLDLYLTEELEDLDGYGEDCCRDSKESADFDGEMDSCKRKKRTVHFADPLFTYIEEKKKEEPPNRPASERKPAQHSRTQSIVLQNLGGTPKQPMSCFDLLCNYAGTKGWRCYRSCIEGESFCNYHLSSRKAASFVRISVCT